MKKKIIIAIVAAIFCASNAMAAEQGAYAGAGVGAATVTDSNGNSGISSNSVGASFSDLSLSVVGGYNITRFIGLEASLNALGIFGWSNASGGSVTALPASIELVGYLPLFSGFDLFGKFGTSYTRLDSSNSLGQGGTLSVSEKTKMYGIGIEVSAGEKNSYLLAIDRYDLSVTPGTSVFANYFNITGLVRF